jgi:hypothetical protein
MWIISCWILKTAARPRREISHSLEHRIFSSWTLFTHTGNLIQLDSINLHNNSHTKHVLPVCDGCIYIALHICLEFFMLFFPINRNNEQHNVTDVIRVVKRHRSEFKIARIFFHIVKASCFQTEDLSHMISLKEAKIFFQLSQNFDTKN